jgi:hypothetical protein
LTAHTALVADTNGRPVAAAAEVGKGRVVVWADDHAYWDFCAQRDRHTGEVASKPTTVALFKWLVGGRTGPDRGRATRDSAEYVDRRGPLIFRHSLPIADAAQAMTARVPDVLKVVQQWNGIGPPEKPAFTIHWLAAGGGGWAGPHAAGVCVFGEDPAYPIKVMGHELTHSTTGPWPRAFSEAWAIIVGMRAAEALGYAESARREIAANIKRLDKVDPTRDSLDLMDSDTGPANHDYQRKALWLLLELEKRYGPDFMARFLDLRTKKHGLRKRIDLRQTFDLFAEVSDDAGILQRFNACGIGTSSTPGEQDPQE